MCARFHACHAKVYARRAIRRHPPVRQLILKGRRSWPNFFHFSPVAKLGGAQFGIKNRHSGFLGSRSSNDPLCFCASSWLENFVARAHKDLDTRNKKEDSSAHLKQQTAQSDLNPLTSKGGRVMRILLKSVFYALTLSILSYGAVAADAQDLVSGEVGTRTCCQYQVDCADNQTCEFIFPYCSADKQYICKAAAAQ